MAMAAFSSPLAYRMRDELGYSLILTHIGHDQDVNDKIKSHVANVLIGTPTVAARNGKGACADATRADIALPEYAGCPSLRRQPAHLPV